MVTVPYVCIPGAPLEAQALADSMNAIQQQFADEANELLAQIKQKLDELE